MEEYKKKWIRNVEVNSKEVFKIAEDATRVNKDINVVIVKRYPRFDSVYDDPIGIKKELSNFANQVYDHEFLRKGSPSNIHIIDVPLSCEKSPHLQDLIYGKRSSLTFNGYKMVGEGASRHLTYRTKQALMPLIKSTLKSSSSQEQKAESDFVRAKNTMKPKTIHNTQLGNSDRYGPIMYSIPVQNRFMGNF